MSSWNDIAFSPAEILLPKETDLTKWAVIACDQFTSEPEYWAAAEQTVGDAPSTLRMIRSISSSPRVSCPMKMPGCTSPVHTSLMAAFRLWKSFS